VQIPNEDATSTMQYYKIEASVPKGNALILALQAGSQQDVGVFDTQQDESAWITNQETNKTPIYQQPEYSPSVTTQPDILVLEQDNQDAYDLILLRRDGAKPSYEARIAPNNQIEKIISQMQTVHPELQNVQPFKETDYQYTLPADTHFATVGLFSPHNPLARQQSQHTQNTVF
jgi:hypothetical protein